MVPVLASAEPGVVVLKKGAKAPSKGVFYTNEAHAKLVSKIKTMEATHKKELEFWKKKLELEMTSALKLKDIEIGALNEKYKITLGAQLNREKLLLKELEKAKLSSVPWYRSPTFVAVVSSVLSIGVCAFAVWGAGRLSK